MGQCRKHHQATRLHGRKEQHTMCFRDSRDENASTRCGKGLSVALDHGKAYTQSR